METILVTDDTSLPELTEAITNLVTASRKVEALIEMCAHDAKRADVYRTRWDSLADKLEMLCTEVQRRQAIC